MLFIVLTVLWVFLMVVITVISPAKTSIHEIQEILIGIGLWIWIATMYFACRLSDERNRIINTLDEIKEAQEYAIHTKQMTPKSRGKKSASFVDER